MLSMHPLLVFFLIILISFSILFYFQSPLLPEFSLVMKAAPLLALICIITAAYLDTFSGG